MTFGHRDRRIECEALHKVVSGPKRPSQLSNWPEYVSATYLSQLCAGLDTAGEAASTNSLADLEFRGEVWDERDLHVVEIIAASGNLLIARAAFEEALKHRPEQILRLRHRARAIRERVR